MFRIPKIAYMVLATSLLAGCAPAGPTKLTLATHDSAVFSEELIAAFEAETGYELTVVKGGDTGALTNKLVLTKDQPIADAVYGIDNTFMGAAEENGILEQGTVTEIDYADICFNYDAAWFRSNKVEPPKDWAQLTEPTYRGLTVLQNPTTSSTGLGFLAATVSRFGEGGWQEFWNALKANDVKVVAGWEDAYYTHFSGSAGKGAYPVVLSYSSSPADEADTVALRTNCFRQTEYAAVLKNAKNSAGAKKLVEWLTKDAFQSTLPTAMYVYPINPNVAIPENWATKAPAALTTIGSELNISEKRKQWLASWSKLFG